MLPCWGQSGRLCGVEGFSGMVAIVVVVLATVLSVPGGSAGA